MFLPNMWIMLLCTSDVAVLSLDNSPLLHSLILTSSQSHGQCKNIDSMKYILTYMAARLTKERLNQNAVS